MAALRPPAAFRGGLHVLSVWNFTPGEHKRQGDEKNDSPRKGRRQAYLEWLHIGGSPFGIKIGRQAIIYADNRVWGPGEWGNVGRYTWDAVKLIADTPLAEVHGIFANRVRYDPHSFDEHDSSLDAYGVYAMVKKLPFRLDLFWLHKRTRPDQLFNAKGDRLDLDTHTVGFCVDGKLGKGWDYGGTLAHTFGDREIRKATGELASDDEVRAWGANARLGYTFDLPWLFFQTVYSF